MKYGRQKTFGNHPFNRRTRGIFYIENNFEEITVLPNINDTFCNILIKDIDDTNLNIFLHYEYSKRNFYLKCKYNKQSGNLTKRDNKRHYSINKFTNVQSCLEYISNIFITKDFQEDFGSENIFYGSLQVKEERERLSLNYILETSDYDIYISIKKLYEMYISLIKNVIKYPENYNIKAKDREYLEGSALYFNDYDYEKLLYYLSFGPLTIQYNWLPSKFKRLLMILNNRLGFILSKSFLILYREIIDKYSIYMNDLFDLSDIEEIIKNKYRVSNIPRYFFLSIEPKIEETKNNPVDIAVNDSKIDISIDLTSNFDSLKILNYVYNSLISSLYFHKELTNRYFSAEEISLFVPKIDFTNKHNKISKINKFKNFIYGLYIWDKAFIDNDSNISHIINILYNKVLKKREKVSSSLERKTRKYFYNAKTNIEYLTLSPIKP